MIGAPGEGVPVRNRERVRRHPTPNDPEVARLSRIQQLEYIALVAANVHKVIAISFRRRTQPKRQTSIAELLGVQDVDVLVGLDGLDKFSLFGLTRGSTRARVATLIRLRGW